MTTDVALEWMFIAMAAHVNSVEDIVRKVNITMLAFMQKLLVRHSQGRVGRARLAVANARGKNVQVVLKAEAGNRTATPLA